MMGNRHCEEQKRRSKSIYRHSGAMRSIEPGISRYPGLVLAHPSRNDRRWIASWEPVIGRAYARPVWLAYDGQIAEFGCGSNASCRTRFAAVLAGAEALPEENWSALDAAYHRVHRARRRGPAHPPSARWRVSAMGRLCPAARRMLPRSSTAGK